MQCASNCVLDDHGFPTGGPCTADCSSLTPFQEPTVHVLDLLYVLRCFPPLGLTSVFESFHPSHVAQRTQKATFICATGGQRTSCRPTALHSSPGWLSTPHMGSSISFSPGVESFPRGWRMQVPQSTDSLTICSLAHREEHDAVKREAQPRGWTRGWSWVAMILPSAFGSGLQRIAGFRRLPSASVVRRLPPTELTSHTRSIAVTRSMWSWVYRTHGMVALS